MAARLDLTVKEAAWRAGLGSFVGVFLLSAFATLFLHVTVDPAAHWSLHLPEGAKAGRALLASLATAAVLSAIIMAGTFVSRRFGWRHA